MTKNNLAPKPGDDALAQFVTDTTSDVTMLFMKAARFGLPKTAKALAGVTKVLGWEIAEILREEAKK